MPNDFTIQEIEELQRALDHLFDQKVFPLTISSQKIKKILDKDKWVNSSDLLGDLKKITDSKSLAEIQKNLSTRKSELETKPTESTVPQNREDLEKERVLRERQERAAEEKGAGEVREFIAREQKLADQRKEIQEELKGKNIYLEPKDKIKPVDLTGTEKDAAIKLYQSATQSPRNFVDEVSSKIVENTPPNLKAAISPEELKVSAQITAIDLAKRLTSKSPVVSPGVFTAIADTKNIFGNVLSKNAQGSVIKSALTAAALSKVSDVTVRTLLYPVFGEKVVSFVYGPDSQSYIATSSPTPNTAYTVHLDNLTEGFGNIVNNPIINFVVGPITDEAKSKVLDFGKDILVSQLSKLPKEGFFGFISRATSSGFLEGALNLLTGSGIEYTTTSFLGKSLLTFFPEYAPLASSILGHFGIDIGISITSMLAPAVAGVAESGATIAGAITTEAIAAGTTGTVATVAGTAGGAAVGSGGGAAAGLLTGPLAPIAIPLFAAAGALLGKLFEKAISKISQWLKEHPAFTDTIKGIGVVLFILGGMTSNLIFLGLGIIPTLLVVQSIVKGNLTLAGAGARTFLFFGRLGRSMAITIGTPIIVAIIVFPILVAIILFIINSGAYLVPPQATLESPFGPQIKCSEAKDPISFPNSSSSSIAKRAWQITADLYQGFWCFWNRSPGDFPNDVTSYPPSYPELFNEKFFALNPNPTRGQVQSCGECMFWCTWLVQKAFREGGNSSLENTLWAPTMEDDFTKRGKFISAQEAAYKVTLLDFIHKTVIPGSVIFFNVSGGPDRTNHVGIVYSVSKQGVQYIQSNAPLKNGFVPFGDNGYGLQSPPGLAIVGIGLP